MYLGATTPKPKSSAHWSERLWKVGLSTAAVSAGILIFSSGAQRQPNPYAADERVLAVATARSAAKLYGEAIDNYSRYTQLVTSDIGREVDSARMHQFIDSAAYYSQLEATLTHTYSAALDSSSRWESAPSYEQRNPRAMEAGLGFLALSGFFMGLSSLGAIYRAGRESA